MTCTCCPRSSGGVITRRLSSSRGMTYSFEMHPAATGAKKASVTRLTAVRTPPLSLQVSCHATRRALVGFLTSRRAGTCRSVPALPRACRGGWALPQGNPSACRDVGGSDTPRRAVFFRSTTGGLDEGFWEAGPRGRRAADGRRLLRGLQRRGSQREPSDLVHGVDLQRRDRRARL